MCSVSWQLGAFLVSRWLNRALPRVGSAGLTGCLLTAIQLAWLLPHNALASNAQTLHTAASITPELALVELDQASNWRFRSPEREWSLANQALVRWGEWPGVRHDQAVWLSDGSWLCGEIQLAAGKLTLVHDWLKVPELPLDRLRGIVLAPPGSLARWLQLRSQMLATEGELDVLWLAGGKRLNGIIRWPPGDQPGIYRQLEVDTAGQVVEVELDSVEAIVFSPTLLGAIPAQPRAFQVGLADGTCLRVARVEPTASRVELTTVAGVTVSSLDEPRRFCDVVNYLASEGPGGDEVGYRYLSDLPVASYRHLSDSTLTWELGVNRDLYGQPLHTSQGQLLHGLATHSSSQVAYRWDGSPARLLAEVQLAEVSPDTAAEVGSVQCQIMLARGGELEKVEDFVLYRGVGQSAGRSINVDISGAKLVVLITDKADFGQYGDQLLWLDARIAQSGSGSAPTLSRPQPQ